MREKLREETKKARERGEDLLNLARGDLDDVTLVEEELRSRGPARDKVARLEGDLEKAGSLLDTTQNAVDRLPGEIKEAKKAAKSAKETLESASVAVRQQVDSTLRRPRI